MIPGDYIDKSYPLPPCWCLVVDVYQNELGLPVAEFKTVNNSIRAIAFTFRLALHKENHGFGQVREPADYCVVLMGKMATRITHHCGIYYQGNVLHATDQGVVFESMAAIQDAWPKTEFWAKT